MRLKLELNPETSEALNQVAERELRYPHQQAEVLLRKALGYLSQLLTKHPPLKARPPRRRCHVSTKTTADPMTRLATIFAKAAIASAEMDCKRKCRRSVGAPQRRSISTFPRDED
jgi:hypothetical protein